MLKRRETTQKIASKFAYFKNFLYPCPRLRIGWEPSREGGGKERTYIHKRRNCTLWFWRHKNFATSNWLSKTKQRERLMGCIIDSHHWLRSIFSSVVKEDDLYIYTGVGLSALLVSTDMSNTNGMVRKWQEQTYEISSRVEARLVFLHKSKTLPLFGFYAAVFIKAIALFYIFQYLRVILWHIISEAR